MLCLNFYFSLPLKGPASSIMHILEQLQTALLLVEVKHYTLASYLCPLIEGARG
jgi:hypothetical protein